MDQKLATGYMIKSKADYQFYLEADRIALHCRRHAGFLQTMKNILIGSDRAWQYQKLLRKVEYLKNCKPGFLWQVRYVLALRKFRYLTTFLGVYIEPNSFGPGLSIAHPHNIGVHGGVQAGANCRIHPDVEIGTNAGNKDWAPRLGNNIFIGPGAKIFGAIEIADDVVIGANCVVTKSVTEPGITIGGIPAQKISDKDSSDYVIRATEILRSQS